MRTSRRNGNGYRSRGDNRRFSSNENYSNHDSNRSYRQSQGYSNADAEHYPLSRAYDDYDNDQYDQSSYGNGDHRGWDNPGYAQFDRSNRNDFRSGNQRYGSNSGMYGSESNSNRSRNRSAGAFGLDYNSEYNPNRNRDNDYSGQDRRNRQYGSSMGNRGFGEYDLDHDERDNRNQEMYGSAWGMGNHRGKGPKGYKRTDERIREDINDRLSDDDNLDASEIEVEVKNGEVTLSGTVSDRSDKRRAEDLAEMISGVSNVENRIRISRDNSEDSDSSSRTKSSNRDSSTKGSSNKSNERSKLQESVA